MYIMPKTDAQKYCPPLRKSNKWQRILLAVLLFIPKMLFWFFSLVMPNLFKKRRGGRYRYIGD